MAWIQMHLFSRTLAEWTTMNLLIPDVESEEPLSLLWLLPPLGMDHTAWLLRGSLAELSAQYNLVMALPDMRLSFGQDMVHGERYNTYLTDELPNRIDEYCHVDKAKQSIFGAREGGFAALYAASQKPDLYDAVGAVDSVNTSALVATGSDTALVRRAFSIGDSEILHKTAGDLCTAMPLAHVFTTQGSQFASSTHMLSEALTGRPASIVDAQGWDGWRMALRQFLDRKGV